MRKIFKKIRTVCVVSVLSFSLCFSSVTVSYYQAAALAPAVWTLIEVLFLSLGITLHLADTADRTTVNEDLAEEARKLAENIENGEQKGSLLELADFFENISSHWMPIAGLIVPLIVWDGLKLFCGMKQESVGPVSVPIDADINLYGCSQEQYLEFFSSYLDLTLKDGMKNFLKTVYPLFLEADYSFIIKISAGIPDAFFSLSVTESYYFRERENGGACYLYPVSIADGSSNYLYSSYTYIPSQDRCVESSTDSIWLPASDTFLMIKGRLYDLNEVCSEPLNTTIGRDYGSSFTIEDFLTSSMDICTGVTADCVIDIPLDDYDVQTPGREWDEEKDKLVGDVPLNIPSQNALDDYYNGLITWDELMEQIGAKPVDTSKPLEGDIPKEDASGGIIDSIGNVIDTIIDTTANIIDAILGIPATLLDGVLWLFIPGDGFIEGILEQIVNRASSLGILPFDMRTIFYSEENPFKDIKVHMYGQDIVIVSFKYLPRFLDEFRPAIRGLMALFMIYYSLNQFLGLFSIFGVMQGDNSHKMNSNSNNKGNKKS